MWFELDPCWGVKVWISLALKIRFRLLNKIISASCESVPDVRRCTSRYLEYLLNKGMLLSLNRKWKSVWYTSHTHTHSRSVIVTPEGRDPLAEKLRLVLRECVCVCVCVPLTLPFTNCAVGKSRNPREGLCRVPADHHRWERHLSNHNSSYQGNTSSVPMVTV